MGTVSVRMRACVCIHYMHACVHMCRVCDFLLCLGWSFCFPTDCVVWWRQLAWDPAEWTEFTAVSFHWLTDTASRTPLSSAPLPLLRCYGCPIIPCPSDHAITTVPALIPLYVRQEGRADRSSGKDNWKKLCASWKETVTKTIYLGQRTYTNKTKQNSIK